MARKVLSASIQFHNKRAIKKLEVLELIHSEKVNAYRENHTKWYLVNFKKLEDLLCEQKPNSIACKTPQNKPIDWLKMSQSCTYKKHTYCSSFSRRKNTANRRRHISERAEKLPTNSNRDNSCMEKGIRVLAPTNYCLL